MQETVYLQETCLSTCKKTTWSLCYFLRYYTSKNPTDWLGAFQLITWETEFCKISFLQWIINNKMNFHLRLFPGKTNDKFFAKNAKTPIQTILGPFCPFFDKLEFSSKFCSYQFFLILTNHCVKLKKKLMNKATMVSNRHMDTQAWICWALLAEASGPKSYWWNQLKKKTINFAFPLPAVVNQVYKNEACSSKDYFRIISC